MIAPDLVLTAAHCLYDARSRRLVPTRALRFLAGVNNGQGTAERRVVRAAAVPAFRFTGRPEPRMVAADVALLELAEPISPDAAAPATVGRALRDNGALTVVSYDFVRSGTPTFNTGCPVRGRFRRVLVLGCRLILGASGAPIFAGNEIIGVVSASGIDPGGRGFTLAVMVLPTLPALRAALEAAEAIDLGSTAP